MQRNLLIYLYKTRGIAIALLSPDPSAYGKNRNQEKTWLNPMMTPMRRPDFPG